MSSVRHMAALAISITVVALLVLGLFALQELNSQIEPPNIVRSLGVSAVVPPPPPSNQTTRESIQSLNLDLQSSARGVLVSMPVKLNPGMTVKDLVAPVPKMQTPTFDMSLTASIQEFGLGQLDSRPRLLSKLSIRFPVSLRRQGVDTVRIQAQVVIDQTGTVTLRRLLGNPHPELDSQIRALIQRARFTPPEKDGQRVRAAFIWPLVLGEQ
ncbi:MAG: energy transducer TonB [Pseudomonadota bacterium]